MKIREYSAPLTVVAAGMLGFSLICLVSAAALSAPGTTNASAIEIEAGAIVDSAFSNPISTAVALTAVEVAEFITTPTSSLADLITLTPTLIPSNTPTLKAFITFTSRPPTRTREEPDSLTPSRTPTRVPSRTPTRTPTRTKRPTSTVTLTPKPEDTDTPLPPPTSTFTLTAPPITDTPIQPTETDIPVTPETPTPNPTPTTPDPTETPLPVSP